MSNDITHFPMAITQETKSRKLKTGKTWNQIIERGIDTELKILDGWQLIPPSKEAA